MTTSVLAFWKRMHLLISSTATYFLCNIQPQTAFHKQLEKRLASVLLAPFLHCFVLLFRCLYFIIGIFWAPQKLSFSTCKEVKTIKLLWKLSCQLLWQFPTPPPSFKCCCFLPLTFISCLPLVKALSLFVLQFLHLQMGITVVTHFLRELWLLCLLIHVSLHSMIACSVDLTVFGVDLICLLLSCVVPKWRWRSAKRKVPNLFWIMDSFGIGWKHSRKNCAQTHKFMYNLRRVGAKVQ